MSEVVKLTETQRAVLELIRARRHLGEYVPSYGKGKCRGRGAFPLTIATRAANQLIQKGLVRRLDTDPFYEIVLKG